MKLQFRSLFVFALATSLIAVSCKKDDDKDNSVDTNTQISSQADDESRVSSELDAVAADAALIIETDPTTSGDNSVLDNIICDGSVSLNTDSDPMTATITYNGENCVATRTRTGKVIISMAKGSEWKNAGTTVNIEFQNVKITRKSDQKSITINGSKSYTNITGGLMYQLPLLQTIIHSVESDGLSIKFDNEAAREWKIARKYNFSYDGGLIINITGMHSEGNVDGIVAWGTNRFGRAFTTSITSALVVKSNCNLRVTAGVLTHTTPSYSATATFGLNAQGNASSCPGEGKYYYRLEANGNNGGTLNALIPY